MGIPSEKTLCRNSVIKSLDKGQGQFKANEDTIVNLIENK